MAFRRYAPAFGCIATVLLQRGWCVAFVVGAGGDKVGNRGAWHADLVSRGDLVAIGLDQ